MIKVKAFSSILLALSCLAFPLTSCSTELTNDEQNSIVLSALMDAGDTVLTKESSCYGIYETTKNETPYLKELLVSRLSTLHSGDNLIKSQCDDVKNGKQDCTLQISHKNGESVSRLDLFFQIDKGQLNASSLRCIMTP